MGQDKSILQVLGYYSSSLMEACSEELPSSLVALHAELSKSLPKTEDPEEFITGSLVRWLVGDFLRLSIEDNYMDFSGSENLSRKFARLLQELSQKPSKQPKWFHALEGFVVAYGKWTLDKRLNPTRTYLTEEIPIALPYKNVPFQISSQCSEILPNLDFALTDPSAAKAVAQLFVQKLEKIKSESADEGRKVTRLCFIEKSYGPIGGLSLVTHLVIQTNLPALVYRPEHWLEVTRVAGSLPSPNDVVCLVYDFVVTGRALIDTARFLREWYKCTVNHAIVYFEFQPEAKEELNREGIKLVSLASLSDQKPQIEELFRRYERLEGKLDQALKELRSQAPFLSEEEYIEQLEKEIEEHELVLQKGRF
jgi:hypothetical protein